MNDDCQFVEKPHDPAIRERMQDIVRRVGRPPAAPRSSAIARQAEQSSKRKRGRPARHTKESATASIMFGKTSNHVCVRLPVDQQREIFRLSRLGFDEVEISRRTKIHSKVVQSVIDRGIVMPAQVSIYRCEGCGSKTESSPCFVCESRALAKRTRREVVS
jgi:hypothetical protein